MLQGKLRHGAGSMSARDALEVATRGGAACLGRTGEIGELSVGACGDLVVWALDGVRFAGALSDPVEAWLRCGPVSARHTVVGGRLVVEDGVPVHSGPRRAARRPPPGVAAHAGGALGGSGCVPGRIRRNARVPHLESAAPSSHRPGAPVSVHLPRPERLPRKRSTKVLVALVAAVVVLFVVVVPGFAFLTGFTKADGGHVVVVRNGGPFDDNSIRQVIQPNSSLTSTGLFSAEHPYPSTQRNFKVSGAKNADSNEVINVPTKDGVLVGVEGTFYFDVNFTDERAMRAFDDKYGTRTYPDPGGNATYAWGGDEGWSAFLEFTLGNLVQNVLRQEIGNVECADLVASCSLAANPAPRPRPSIPTRTATRRSTRCSRRSTTASPRTSTTCWACHPHPPALRAEQGGPSAERPGGDQQGPGRVRRRHRVAGGPAARAGRRPGQRRAAERLQRLPDLRPDGHPEVAARGLTTYAPGTGFTVTGK